MGVLLLSCAALTLVQSCSRCAHRAKSGCCLELYACQDITFFFQDVLKEYRETNSTMICKPRPSFANVLHSISPSQCHQDCIKFHEYDIKISRTTQSLTLSSNSSCALIKDNLSSQCLNPGITLLSSFA